MPGQFFGKINLSDRLRAFFAVFCMLMICDQLLHMEVRDGSFIRQKRNRLKLSRCGACYRRVLRVSWTDHRTNEWVLSRLEVEKSLLARIRNLKLSYYEHIMRKPNCLEKSIIRGCVPGSRGRGDQGDDGGRISVTRRDFGSTMQQDLRKTRAIGEGSYVPPTLQLEDGNRRRRLHAHRLLFVLIR